MNKEPETYEELILQKRCIELTRYYELSKEEVEKIYDFLINNKDAFVKGGLDNVSLMTKSGVVDTIPTRKTPSIDSLTMSIRAFNIVPHYVPPTYYGGSSSSRRSSGRSSNNNNNNN
ncbi:MAG: hypothetical protein IK997_00230, partial [Bacilli bacterium]|nr:hypothetical protein [Bacilli bacterium]